VLSAYNSAAAKRNGLGYVVLGSDAVADLWFGGLGADCGCDCGGTCGGGLGAITPDEAAQQAMPKSSIRSTPGFTQTVYNDIVNAASSGMFTDYNAQNCPSMGPSGTGAQALSLVSSGSGLALSTSIQAGLITAGPATMGITIAIAGITALFGTIFNHHAAAVAKEQRVLCASGPAANNYLQIIRQAVNSGAATPQQGIEALRSLLNDYTATVAPIIKNNSSQCNAACVELKELTAVVAYEASVYQDMANAPPPPAPAPSAVSPAVSTPGSGSAGAGPTATPVSSGSTLVLPAAAPAAAPSSPNWMGIAALVGLGFLAWRFV
jgi:hypothetical protein